MLCSCAYALPLKCQDKFHFLSVNKQNRVDLAYFRMENMDPEQNLVPKDSTTISIDSGDQHNSTEPYVEDHLDSEFGNGTLPSMDPPMFEMPEHTDDDAQNNVAQKTVEQDDKERTTVQHLLAADVPRPGIETEQGIKPIKVPEPINVDDQLASSTQPQGANIIDLDNFVLSASFSDRARHSFSPQIKTEEPKIAASETPQTESQHQRQTGSDQQDAIIIDGEDPLYIKNENDELQLIWTILPSGTINLLSDDEDEVAPVVKQPEITKTNALVLESAAPAALPARQTTVLKKRLFERSADGKYMLTDEQRASLEQFHTKLSEDNTREDTPEVNDDISGKVSAMEGQAKNDADRSDGGTAENNGANMQDSAAAEERLDSSSSESDDGSKFQELKKEFNKKKKKGEISFAEEIAFLKAQKQEEVRRRRLELDEQ